MKKLLRISLAAFGLLASQGALAPVAQAQPTVTIPAGNGGGTPDAGQGIVPFSTVFTYVWSSAIYTSAEVGQGGFITEIRYYTESVNNPQPAPVKLYLKQRASASFASVVRPDEERSGATLVYDRTLPGSAFVPGQWVNLPLDVPFNYDPTSNLQVYIETTSAQATENFTNQKQFRYSTAGPNSAVKFQGMFVPPAGLSTSDRPNVQLVFQAAAVAPTISGFTPTSGPVGTLVTVTGTDLTGATAVTLNGAAVPGYTVASATTITFTVPAGASSGLIAVTTPGGTATSATPFTVTVPANPAPVLSSLSPATAVAGSPAFTLTVNGTGFVAASVVSFNGAGLPTTFVSATQLTAAVPASAVATAGSYPVTVASPAPGGGVSNALAFAVTVPATPVPTISGFTPASGPVGTVVTVTGTNLTGTTALTLNGAAVPGYTVVNATTLTFAVPAGATSGLLAVTTPGGTATSAARFTVTVVSAAAAGQALAGLRVFPNPARGAVTVGLPGAGAATAGLRDPLGRWVLAPAPLAADGQLALPAGLAPGLYLLDVAQGETRAVRRLEIR